jgi:hypothetical protein
MISSCRPRGFTDDGVAEPLGLLSAFDVSGGLTLSNLVLQAWSVEAFDRGLPQPPESQHHENLLSVSI